MQIDKQKAIDFLVALGFPKAVNWEDDKLIDRLGKVPIRYQEEEIPEGFNDLYEALSNSEKDEPIELKEGGSKGKKKSKPSKFKEPQTEEPKETEDKEEMKSKKKASKKKASKKKASGAPTPAKAKKEKAAAKPKKEAAASKEVERDAFGNKVGTISAKVNAVLQQDWNDEESIASEAGVTLDQARGRLYYAQQEGLVECRRLVQYRLVSGKKDKK